jgi:hypothetical protein
MQIGCCVLWSNWMEPGKHFPSNATTERNWWGRSGDHRGQCISPPWPIHWPWKLSSMKLWTWHPNVVVCYCAGTACVLWWPEDCPGSASSISHLCRRYIPMMEFPSRPAHTLSDLTFSLD